MTEADAGEIIVPPRRQNRPMRPAYSQSTTNRDDEWVIGGKANYRSRQKYLSENDVHVIFSSKFPAKFYNFNFVACFTQLCVRNNYRFLKFKNTQFNERLSKISWYDPKPQLLFSMLAFRGISQLPNTGRSILAFIPISKFRSGRFPKAT